MTETLASYQVDDVPLSRDNAVLETNIDTLKQTLTTLLNQCDSPSHVAATLIDVLVESGAHGRAGWAQLAKRLQNAAGTSAS